MCVARILEEEEGEAEAEELPPTRSFLSRLAGYFFTASCSAAHSCGVQPSGGDLAGGRAGAGCADDSALKAA